MKIMTGSFLTLGLAVCCLAGCGDGSKQGGQGSGGDDENAIQTELAALSPEDRKLAEEQRFCPLMPGTRLGSTGAPIKVMVSGQPLMVCCDQCERNAQRDPDRTLAKLKELKNKNAGNAAP